MVGAAQSAQVPAAVELPAPVRIDIDALGVSVPVVPVGIQDDGQLEIPDETQVGWYSLGASPDSPERPSSPGTSTGTASTVRSSASANSTRERSSR